MVSSPITSWQIDGETMETMTLYFGGSKITADGACSHEIKRCLLLGRKTMTNIDSILKSRDITLPTKVHIVKTMIFPVVMYRDESRLQQHSLKTSILQPSAFFIVQLSHTYMTTEKNNSFDLSAK